MQIFTHFVNLNLNTSLKRPVNPNLHKGTIDTHSTIADRQHRVFLTFLTFLTIAVICCVSTAHIVSQYMSLWQQSIAHSGIFVRKQH